MSEQQVKRPMKETWKIKMECMKHPGTPASFDIWNLAQDEHLVVCRNCFLDWVTYYLEKPSGLPQWK